MKYSYEYKNMNNYDVTYVIVLTIKWVCDSRKVLFVLNINGKAMIPYLKLKGQVIMLTSNPHQIYKIYSHN